MFCIGNQKAGKKKMSDPEFSPQMLAPRAPSFGFARSSRPSPPPSSGDFLFRAASNGVPLVASPFIVCCLALRALYSGHDPLPAMPWPTIIKNISTKS